MKSANRADWMSMTSLPQDDPLYGQAAVQGLFDRMSHSYERMNIIMSFGFSVRWRRQMLRLLPKHHAAGTVLDAMSGMGETWGELLRRYPRADLAALDFSPRMVEHASTRNAERFGSRFTLHCEDILDNTLPTAAYDVVVSAYGMKTFNPDQTRRFVDQLARILRPGGNFAFIEVTQPSNRLLRALYTFYLAQIVPRVGVLLVSDPVEYRMLHRYLRNYGDGSVTARALQAHPELHVSQRTHFFGCATSWSGYRVAGVTDR